MTDWPGFRKNFCNLTEGSALYRAVAQPLALVVSERTIPGTQLLGKLNDLGYRTEHLKDLGRLIQVAEYMKPLVIFMDLEWKTRDPLVSINSLVRNPATEYTPIIAYAPMSEEDRLERALNTGATLVTVDSRVLPQLERLLDQAMEID